MIGSVEVAPHVLATMVELTALTTPGVAARHRQRRLVSLRGGGPPQDVRLETGDDGVRADLSIIVEPGADVHEVGRAVQRGVARAVHDLAGLAVREVNVYIQDIDGTA